MKYQHKTGAIRDDYPPFTVGETEIVLTAVTLMDIAPGDTIKLEFLIEWVKPVIWDMGELEIMIRRGAPGGVPVYWTLESCFARAKSKEVFTHYGTEDPVMTYYLCVRSSGQRAIISGDYSLYGTVEST